MDKENPPAPQDLERYRLLIEQAGDAIYMVDTANGRILDCNQQACRELGYSREELLTLSAADIEARLNPGEVHERLKPGIPVTLRGAHRRKDGTTFPVELRLCLIGSGGSQQLVSIVRNDTERVRMEEALKESEEKYRTLIENANDGIIIIQDGVLQFANHRMAELDGSSVEQLIGSRFTEHVHPDELSRIEDIYRRRMAGENVPSAYETVLRRRDGSAVPSELNAAVVTYRGRPASLVIIRDITGRKKAEELSRQTWERYRTLVENLNLGIMLIAPDRTILAANSWVARMHGTTSEALTGKKCFQVFEKGGGTCLGCPGTSTLERGCFSSAEVRRAQPDGSEAQLLVHTLPVQGGDGRIQSFIKVIEDITERNKAEEALKESEERYRTLFESIQEGVAYCRMLYDAAGRPVDWVYLGVNGAFYRSTGLPDVVGKKATEAVPWIKGSKPDLLEIYGRVASTGKPERFENYFEALGAWLDISVVSPAKGYFVAVFENITERKNAEAALRKSEDRFRIISENSLTGIYIRQDGVLKYVNPYLLRVLGYAKEEMIGRDPLDFIHPDDRPVVEEYLLKRASGSKEMIRSEIRLRLKNGSFLTFDLLGGVIDYDGRPAILGNLLDITSRKQAEEALRKSEERFRKISESSLAGIYIIQDNVCKYVNPVMAQMLGYASEELTGKDLLDFVHPGDRGKAEESLRRRLAGQVETVRYEIRLVRKDGNVRVFDLFGSRIEYDGRPAAMGNLVDVTDRRLAEEALQRSTHFLATTVNSLGEWIHVVDADMRLVLVNSSFEAMVRSLGFDGELIGSPLTAVVPSLFPGVLEEYRNVFESGTVLRTEETAEFGGRTYHSETVKTPVFEGRKVVRVITMIRDITGRKRLEESLAQSQKMGAIGQLAGGIAHDFNNLLNVIIGFSDLALREMPPQSPVYGDVEEVRKAAKRAALLTSQLLAFSRKQSFLPAALSLNDVLVDMEQMLRRLIGEDIELQIRLDPGLGHIFADRTQTEQVVLNLAANARDAMPRGGKLTIATANAAVSGADCAAMPEARPGEFVCLSVTDTGSGMDEETIRHIFEPFFTTKGLGKGTGLGLSVIYGIVKQQEGWIKVVSAPGTGTEFRIYVPAYDAETERTEAGKQAVPDGGASGARVLLVEDEEGILKMVRRLLAEDGYRVFAASSAEEALQVFERENGDFQLLFTDAVLPGKRGIELADELQARNPRIRVLISSGYLDDRAQLPDIRARGYHYLQKPYEIDDLAAAVRKALKAAWQGGRDPGPAVR